jgi:drug/metabolite transporter (DMT)-like permease
MLQPSRSPLIGVVLLVLSSWALSTLDTSAKWIMAAGAPILLVGWVRFCVHLLLVLLLTRPRGIRSVLRTQRPYSQLLRGIVMLAGTFTFFTALRHLPQAEATAIIFLSPLLVLAAAPWILKEPPRLSRWLAALGGFVGIVVIIRPGSGLDPVGTGLALLTAFLFATQHLCTRRVAVDDPITTLVWSGGVGSICLTLALPYILMEAYPFVKDFGIGQWLILLGTGFWGALGHLLQVQAYRHAPASLLAPFVYLQIIAAAVLGWLVWGHFPDALTWLGIGIVGGSGIIIGLVEWRRRSAAPAEAAA